MKPSAHRDRIPSIAVLGILALSFLMVALTFPSAHAYTPTVGNTAAGKYGGAGTTYTVTLTVNAIGDTVAVYATAKAETVSNTLITTTGVSSPGAGAFTELNFVIGTCTGSPVDGQCGGVAGQNWFAEESLWSATATATGAITITVTISLTGAATDGTGAEAFDLQFVSSTPSVSSSHCDAAAHTSCVTPGGVNALVPTDSATNTNINILGAGTWSQAVSTTPGCTFVQPAAPAVDTMAGWQVYANLPTNSCGVQLTGFSGYESGYVLLQTIWTPSTVTTTVTSIINNFCTGACSGGNNGTSTVFSVSMPHEFVFYYSQNTASAGLIDNVSLKIGTVHINTATGKMFILTYTPATETTAPSGGNPWTLRNTQTVPIINNTSNFFVHNNPQVNIAASAFFAVGVMFNTNASRGSGAAGDGVKVFETSQTGITEYSFNPPSTTPPTSFFSSTTKTPRDWIFIHLFSTVATTTVSTTSTITLSGTVSTTTTITSTTLDESIAINSVTNYAIALMLILGPGLLLGGAIGIWTRSFPGVAVGMIVGILIGTGLGVQANVVTVGFEALAAIAVVFLGVMAFVSSRGGG